MNFIKDMFQGGSGNGGMSIQLKVFLILFAFLIAQASFQLYENVKQGSTALEELTKNLQEDLSHITELQNSRLDELMEKNKEMMRNVGGAMMTSLSYMMNSGNADIARQWIEGMRENTEFRRLQVFRTYKDKGEEAFLDNKTVNAVNEWLNDTTFSRHFEKEKEMFAKEHMDSFDRAMEAMEPQFYQEVLDGAPVFTGLFPMENTEECQMCHGEDHKVRGLLRISFSAEEQLKKNDAIQAQLKAEEGEQKEKLAEMKHKSASTRNLAIIAAIVLIAINLAVLNIFFRFTVINPVNKIAEIAGRIARGDLTSDIDTARKDEIGVLSNALYRMQDNLKNMIFKINESSSHVTTSASELSNLARHIADGSEKQTEQTTHVATSVEEMSATIMEIARNSSEALACGNQARETADGGANVVEETISGIHRISAAMEQSSKVVDALGVNSDQINEIVSVIDDIADQTNLLALNAAIEAARAGEAGRGFAVVADEVRKLAERTTKATKEIATMIGKIQADTRDAVIAMETATEEVKTGVKLADQTGQSLKEIVVQVQSSADMISHIATAAEEQSKAVEEISRNVNNVADVSRETSRDTQKTSESAENLMKLAGELERLVEQFKV